MSSKEKLPWSVWDEYPYASNEIRDSDNNFVAEFAHKADAEFTVSIINKLRRQEHEI